MNIREYPWTSHEYSMNIVRHILRSQPLRRTPIQSRKMRWRNQRGRRHNSRPRNLASTNLAFSEWPMKCYERVTISVHNEFYLVDFQPLITMTQTAAGSSGHHQGTAWDPRELRGTARVTSLVHGGPTYDLASMSSNLAISIQRLQWPPNN